MTQPALFFETTAKSLRPRQEALWRGYAVECERQARRTTFLRVIGDDDLAGIRIQVKHSHKVTVQLP